MNTRDSYVTVDQEDVQVVVEKVNESKKRELEHDESVKNKEGRSPEAKKKKLPEDVQERLEEDIKAISQILHGISCRKLKHLISCFSPGMRDCPDIIIQAMMTCSEDWEDKEENFIKAIQLIKQEPFEKNEDRIEQLSGILLGEILNRMSRCCRDC